MTEKKDKKAKLQEWRMRGVQELLQWLERDLAPISKKNHSCHVRMAVKPDFTKKLRELAECVEQRVKLIPDNESRSIDAATFAALSKKDAFRFLQLTGLLAYALSTAVADVQRDKEYLQEQRDAFSKNHDRVMEDMHRQERKRKRQLRALREMIDSFGFYSLEDRDEEEIL